MSRCACSETRRTTPQTEQEARDCALAYLQERFAGAVLAMERDEWLHIDRIGMRLLGREELTS